MSVICQVYKSPRRAETYLYVEHQRGVADVPEALLASFGEPQAVMLLHLTPERRLARAKAIDILNSIETQGYYLQVPPSPTYAADAGAGNAREAGTLE
ncbi:MAG: YcgL domain-containing protein [Halioglobus sp.]